MDSLLIHPGSENLTAHQAYNLNAFDETIQVLVTKRGYFAYEKAKQPNDFMAKRYYNFLLKCNTPPLYLCEVWLENPVYKLKLLIVALYFQEQDQHLDGLWVIPYSDNEFLCYHLSITIASSMFVKLFINLNHYSYPTHDLSLVPYKRRNCIRYFVGLDLKYNPKYLRYSFRKPFILHQVIRKIEKDARALLGKY